METTKIIAGFPATGKTFISKNGYKDLVILDSDSSSFSWLTDEHGAKTCVRNPKFPNNYIQHIKDNIGKADIIFVSTHSVVQEALEENNIPYILVYPDIRLKGEWIKRFKNRGNNKEFINNMITRWEMYIKGIEENDFAVKLKLGKGEYILDHLEGIIAFWDIMSSKGETSE